MPRLQEIQQKTMILPSTEALPPEQQVTLQYREGLTIGDLRVYNPAESDLENGILLLSKLIVGWDLTDAENNAMPINPNTIATLPAGDLIKLIALVENVVPKDMGIDLTQKKS